MSLPNHGANPHQLAKALKLTLPDHVIDFSENTNPFGPPSSLFKHMAGEDKAIFAAYPDPHVTALTNELAKHNDVSPSTILVGNGAAELIFLIASYFRNKRVRVVEPAFSEYRDAALAYDCYVDSYVLQKPWLFEKNDINKAIDRTDLLFLCTPNNPTGVTYDQKTITALVQEAAKQDVVVVIDEAFYDFCETKKPLHTLIHTYDNVIVLRSLTKMYAIAGVRLGYIITHKKMVAKLKRLQPPWSVNGIAQQVGLRLLSEQAFVQNSVNTLQRERIRLQTNVEKLGYDMCPSTVNFYLLKDRMSPSVRPLFLYLIKHGAVVRHTYNFNGLDGNYIRIAVKDKESNDFLLHLLRRWREKQ